MAIHQPNYLPYPGFFAKLLACDLFVIYDTAQFTRSDFINRNRIRTFSPNGWLWLTLPVGKKDFKNIQIRNVQINEEDVFRRHGALIKSTYSKTPFFDKSFCDAISKVHINLSEHNVFLIRNILGKLAIEKPQLILASEIDCQIRPSTQGLIDITKALGGTEYISGIGGNAYLQPKSFKQESIKCSFLNYKPIQYQQMHPGFVPDMSLIDAAFNVGWKETVLKLQKSIS